MNADNVLKGMRLTEKANKQSAELGQYTFEVVQGATKHAIARGGRADLQGHGPPREHPELPRQEQARAARGQPSTTSDYKKAIVTLKAGDKIELV